MVEKEKRTRNNESRRLPKASFPVTEEKGSRVVLCFVVFSAGGAAARGMGKEAEQQSMYWLCWGRQETPVDATNQRRSDPGTQAIT
jgi:hypothetical protein